MSIKYRCYEGYRNIFSGRNLKLDENLVPIIRVPNQHSSKTVRAMHITEELFRNVADVSLPGAMIAYATMKMGDIPYIHSCAVSDIKEEFDETFKEWVTFDFEQEYEEFIASNHVLDLMQ